MKNINIIHLLVILLFTFTNCEKNHDQSNNQITDGLCIQFGDLIIINHEEIDYYDFSTHMIYLKETNDFFHNYNWELANMSFSVYANREKIYSGYLHPAWSSSSPVGPYINFPFRYPEYVIKINHSSEEYYYLANSTPDPREDEEIINTLKVHEQFHAGLANLINEIDIKPNGELSFKITIANKDTFNYYILSPEKMGIGLFHYFTNGLSFYNQTTGWLNHQCATVSPEPWDSWSIDWLDLIESGMSKSYNIHYSDFDTIPSGQYHVSFHFPGLFNVEIEDINQSNGRIWLGGVTTKMESFVE